MQVKYYSEKGQCSSASLLAEKSRMRDGIQPKNAFFILQPEKNVHLLGGVARSYAEESRVAIPRGIAKLPGRVVRSYSKESREAMRRSRARGVRRSRKRSAGGRGRPLEAKETRAALRGRKEGWLSSLWIVSCPMRLAGAYARARRACYFSARNSPTRYPQVMQRPCELPGTLIG